MLQWLTKLIGAAEARKTASYLPLVARINDLEPEQLKKLLEGGKTLDDILPEAFAAVRESSCRTTGLRHFDVQLIGGIVLHQGKIAEMKTGEGKTIVAF